MKISPTKNGRLAPAEVHAAIDSLRSGMIELQRLLTSIPALAPENGGVGEDEKAAALTTWLKQQGFPEPEVYRSPDARVPSGSRPNLVVTIPGRDNSRAVWFMAHLDVVPPGEAKLWNSDPWTVVEKDGRLYGRGVEDNQQGLTSTTFAVLSMLKAGVTPLVTVKLLYVADEEVGSAHGIQFLVNQHRELFGARDWFVVPDSGRPDGSMIEVAEKNLLWLRFTLRGKQVHASMPQLGNNAFLAGSRLAVRLSEMTGDFPQQNRLFDPPYSTFCPTKKEANVPNINTIPGEDVFYLDCRILPEVGLAAVRAKITEICRQMEQQTGCSIAFEAVQEVASKATAADCPLVKAVQRAVKREYQVDGVPTGVGGGTVAAYLRNAGYDAVIWSRLDETAHMPNEYCIVDNLVGDAHVSVELVWEAAGQE